MIRMYARICWNKKKNHGIIHQGSINMQMSLIFIL